MRKLGRKEMTLHLQERLSELPPGLATHRLTLVNGGDELVYTYNSETEKSGVSALFRDLAKAGIRLKDVQTRQSSLEEIFVGLLRERQ
jgi:ABC-2 type transport system ATP-binding protein